MKFIRLTFVALIAMLQTFRVANFSLSSRPNAYPEIKSKRSNTLLNNIFNTRNTADVDNSVPCSKADKNTMKLKESARNDAVLTVKSVKDYQELIIDEVEKVTILRFSASWCRVSKISYICHPTADLLYSTTHFNTLIAF